MPLAVFPGDLINMDVKYLSGTYVLAVSDLTDHQSYTKKVPCGAGVVCNRQSAEWIVERPGIVDNGQNTGLFPLADYGSTSMTNDIASVDGQVTTVPLSDFLNSALFMSNGNTDLSEAATSFSDSDINTNLLTGQSSFLARWLLPQ
jgi:hypothetical protein